MFSTSIDWPSIAYTTSPGFVALPPGMFSVQGATAITFTAGASRAIACIEAITAAAPVMSPFMRSIPAPGLSEMPPVSKVMPLPTNAIGFWRPPPW